MKRYYNQTKNEYDKRKMKEDSEDKYNRVNEKSPLWKMIMLEDPSNRGSETKANDIECHKTQEYQNQRVVTGCHDDTTEQEVQTERNYDYDRNANGTNSCISQTLMNETSLSDQRTH